MEKKQKRLTVFFDRDGTLNVEKGYIRDLADLDLYPEAAPAIRTLNDLGVLCCLTTNQTGAARGFYSLEHVDNLNNKINILLEEEAGAHLDAIFSSPYYSRGSVPELTKDSPCRKPGTGMIIQAIQQFPEIDLEHAYILGDKATDVEFAHNAGCRGILLRTGYGQNVIDGKYQKLVHQPYRICAHVGEAVDSIIADWKAEGLLT
jgi:D-glycero-D-manno-heptose 1,7-bisphosphate phosphatase